MLQASLQHCVSHTTLSSARSRRPQTLHWQGCRDNTFAQNEDTRGTSFLDNEVPLVPQQRFAMPLGVSAQLDSIDTQCTCRGTGNSALLFRPLLSVTFTIACTNVSANMPALTLVHVGLHCNQCRCCFLCCTYDSATLGILHYCQCSAVLVSN